MPSSPSETDQAVSVPVASASAPSSPTVKVTGSTSS